MGSTNEEYVPLTEKVIKELHDEITELVAKNLSLHSKAVKGEHGWAVEFYANHSSEYDVVGNLYIPELTFDKLRELMRIEKADREDLTEALVNDDEEIRDAADTRMYELALKAAKLAEVRDDLK